MSKFSKKNYALSCVLLLLTGSFLTPLPANAGWVEVHANTVAITVKSESATFKEVLTAVFAELNAKFKSEEKFTVDDVSGDRKITIDFATDSRANLMAKLQEVGKCRMVYAADTGVIAFLPARDQDPFKTDMGMPR